MHEISSRNFEIAACLSALLIILLASCSQTIEITPTIAGTVAPPETQTSDAGVSTDTPPVTAAPDPAFAFDLTSGPTELQEASALIWLSGDRIAVAGSDRVALVGLPSPGAAPQALQPAAIASGDNPILMTASQNKAGIAWVSAGNAIQYWATLQSDQATTLLSSEYPVTGLAINPQEDTIAFATAQGGLIQIEVSSNTITKNWQYPSWLVNLSYSPDNKHLAGIDLANFTATIFSQDGLVERQLVWTGSASSTLYGGYLSPDWTTIAWVSQSAVQLMDVSTGQEGRLLNHEDAVSTVAWSPDSKLIATAAAMTDNGELKPVVFLWSPGLDQPVSTFLQNAPVQNLTFSPDGQKLAVLEVSGSVQIFNLSR